MQMKNKQQILENIELPDNFESDEDLGKAFDIQDFLNKKGKLTVLKALVKGKCARSGANGSPFFINAAVEFAVKHKLTEYLPDNFKAQIENITTNKKAANIRNFVLSKIYENYKNLTGKDLPFGNCDGIDKVAFDKAYSLAHKDLTQTESELLKNNRYKLIASYEI